MHINFDAVLGDRRISLKRLWLSEHFEIKAAITGMLVAHRKAVTQRSSRFSRNTVVLAT